MSNDEALRRSTHGGTVLLFDVPPGTEFGIDCTIFTVGDKFRGVKMIPPGLHLVLLGAAGHDVTRVAEFVRVGVSDVVVRKWDPATETFASGSGYDEAQTERLQMGARQHDFDAFTGPYPAESLEIWNRLTSHVSETVLNQCGVPLGSRVAPGDPDQPLEAHARGPESAEAARRRAIENAGAKPENSQDIPVAPNFGDAASRAPEGVPPEVITKLGADPSARLARAVDDKHGGDWSSFLGAQQLAFVLFLVLGSEPALMFWKTSSSLICDAAFSATSKHRLALYEAFATSFAAQLDRANETLFQDEDLGDDSSNIESSFLRKALVNLTGGLKRATEEMMDPGNSNETPSEDTRRLVQEVSRKRVLLEQWVTAKFGVDLVAEYVGVKSGEEMDAKDSSFPFPEDDDDAPVVAELPEGTFMRMNDVTLEDGEEIWEGDTQSPDTNQARMGWMVQ